jgi:hypothetical protein
MNAIDQSTALVAVQELFQGYPCAYWIAGGWALDLYSERVTRAHDDVDVLVLARDLDQLAATFRSARLDVSYPETGERRPWADGESLEPGPQALVFPDGYTPYSLQILMAASDADEWVYHRGRGTIRKPLADITLRTSAGLPYLAPEIVLLFKSRGMRPKDHEDFLAVQHLLDEPRRRWLADRIVPRYPDHPWLPILSFGIKPDDPEYYDIHDVN